MKKTRIALSVCILITSLVLGAVCLLRLGDQPWASTARADDPPAPAAEKYILLEKDGSGSGESTVLVLKGVEHKVLKSDVLGKVAAPEESDGKLIIRKRKASIVLEKDAKEVTIKLTGIAGVEIGIPKGVAFYHGEKK